MAAPGHEVEDEWARSTLADRIEDAVDRLDHYRGKPGLTAAGVALIVLIVVVGWWFGRAPDRRPVEALIPQVSLDATVATTTPPADVIVHVAGAVRAPEVYRLPPGARIIDAVEAAGGALDGADLDQLNLAAVLADGMQIRVPLVGETIAAPVIGAPESTSQGPIDLNRASASQLDELPGVGPATAEAIIGWRADNGPFALVEDLLAVPGIGPAKLEAIADLVTVG